ncbi:hypothetical protein [Chryseobacterium sp. JUb7]|uniref:hypothetical protein n=1 Tax=Chryseobacterium sp. JUb7 TaxID=2940599 RepID=UPI002167ACD8|nr:hypothetical protein [Chryseobacterium sp. JUb7]MCS3532461.1 hypothetical protein [Chryseobacterium sp. JUb7]
MKKTNFYLLAALFFVTLTLSFTKYIDFVEIYRDKKQVIYKQPTDFSSGWIKQQKFAQVIKNKKGKIIKTGEETTLQYWLCDCENEKYRIGEYITYGENGIIGRGVNSEPAKRVIPESIGEFIFESFCKKEKPANDSVKVSNP